MTQKGHFLPVKNRSYLSKNDWHYGSYIAEALNEKYQDNYGKVEFIVTHEALLAFLQYL